MEEVYRKWSSNLKRFVTATRGLVIVTVVSCAVVLIRNSFQPNEPSGVGSFTTANGTEYKFPCVVSQPEAISSIKRAKSDYCKIEIANAACKSIHGRLFPASTVHRCPTGKYMPYRLVGCFLYQRSQFNTTARMLENTPKTCVDTCMNIAYRYAGVVAGNLCLCGDAEPDLSLLGTDLKCSKPCSGNPSQMCGGEMHVSVYETGFAKQPTEPIKREPKSDAKPARLAFLLMFHKRNLRQIRRLLGAIYDQRHYYYIHVDARQNYLFREMLNLETNFPNIHVARQRHTIAWGCDSQLQMVLHCIQGILTMPAWEPDFIISLSESDFPVKSVAKLTSFLTANPGRNFLLQQKLLPPQKVIPATGLDKNFVECGGRMWDIGKRTPPTGIAYQGGSDWFCFTKEFAKYTIDTNDDLVGDLQALMKYSGFGTEFFYHTLLHNSRFCQTHYDSNLRLVSWRKGHGCSNESQTIDWTGCSPVYVRSDDWSDLMWKVKDDIFLVRKFNPIFDQTIVLKFDEIIYGKYPPNTPNLNSYWENVYHRDDRENNPKAVALSKIAYALLESYRHEHDFHRYEAFDVLEITHYFDRNTFYGFLIRHQALINDRIVEAELLVKPRNMYKPIPTPKDEIDIKTLQIYVTNSVDKTERLPTDFDKVLTVNETPILVVHLPTRKLYSDDCVHTIRVDFIDPYRKIKSAQEFEITGNPANPKYHVLRGHLDLPLMPGSWEAKVYLNESAIGTVEFLVTSIDHLPQWNTCPSTGFSAFIHNQCNVDDKVSYFRSLPHPRATITRFFEVQKVCALYEKSTLNSLQDAHIENCYETLWSSVAPDPKSDIMYLVKRQKLSRG